jgi:hypothetical protein
MRWSRQDGQKKGINFFCPSCLDHLKGSPCYVINRLNGLNYDFTPAWHLTVGQAPGLTRLAWGTTTDSLLSGVPTITNKQLFYPDPNDTQACAYDCACYFDATDNYWYVGYTWQAPNYDFYVKISRTQDLVNAEHIFLDTSSPEPIEGARIYRTAGIVYFEGAGKGVAR